MLWFPFRFRLRSVEWSIQQTQRTTTMSQISCGRYYYATLTHYTWKLPCRHLARNLYFPSSSVEKHSSFISLSNAYKTNYQPLRCHVPTTDPFSCRPARRITQMYHREIDFGTHNLKRGKLTIYASIN